MPSAADILAAFEEQEGEVDVPEDFESRLLQTFDDLLRCQICHALMNVPVFLKKCNHSFCSTCVRGHYHRQNRCPLRYCSTEFSLGDIVPNMALEKIIKCYRGVNDEAGARDVVLRLQKKSKKYKRSKQKKASNRTGNETDGSFDSSSTSSSSSSSSDSNSSGEEPHSNDDSDFEISKTSSYFAGNKKNGTSTSRVASESPVPEKRLPPKILSTMKMPALRKELKKNGLSSTGDKALLIKRWERYQQLYNAELDSSSKRSISKIRRQVELEEKAKVRQENMSNKSKKAPKKLLAKANMGFDNLVQGMKLKMKGKKKKTSKLMGIQMERLPVVGAATVI